MRKFKILVLITTVLCSYNNAEAQRLTNPFKKKKLDLYEEEKLDFEQYKNHVGEILFSNDEFERQLPESKYITSYTLGDKLGMRAFLKNSPANSMMLQLVESGEKIKTVNKWKGSFDTGALLYKMYLDGKFISNTSYAHSFKNDEIASLPTHRADLKDDNGIYFGEELYESLLKKEELLTPGTHKLKLELIPIYNGSAYSSFEFAPIATGEIDLVITEGATYVKLDECFPKPKTKDAKIESEITKIINAKIVPESKLRDVIITSSRWTLLRNPYGSPIKKSIKAALVFTNNGETFYYERIFEKVYDGVEYSPLQMSSDINIKGESMPQFDARIVHSKCEELLKK